MRVKKGRCTKTEDKKLTFAIPYVHKVSHRLKMTTSRAGVHVLFSTPNKLQKLCIIVNSDASKAPSCIKKYQNMYATCTTGVIYHIPLSCSHCYYIVQTGHCINDRLRQHENFF